jgi:hemerythrin
MKDKLAIIDRIIEWHQTIRGHVKLVGDSISDREALLALEKTRSEWIPGQLEALAEKQKKLKQAMSFLDEGLQNHFAYEEEVLPPLLGELFMKALILDHREVKKEIDEAKSMAAEAELEGLSRDELLLQESNIQQAVDSVCRLIEEHASNEEVILEMARRALQSMR